MSGLKLDCLRMLRLFGPCSNAEVGRKLGVKPDKTYPTIYQLVQEGYACHPKKQAWSITPKGRRLFDRMHKSIRLLTCE